MQEICIILEIIPDNSHHDKIKRREGHIFYVSIKLINNYINLKSPLEEVEYFVKH
jgi:hypothetical protein